MRSKDMEIKALKDSAQVSQQAAVDSEQLRQVQVGDTHRHTHTHTHTGLSTGRCGLRTTETGTGGRHAHMHPHMHTHSHTQACTGRWYVLHVHAYMRTEARQGFEGVCVCIVQADLAAAREALSEAEAARAAAEQAAASQVSDLTAAHESETAALQARLDMYQEAAADSRREADELRYRCVT